MDNVEAIFFAFAMAKDGDTGSLARAHAINPDVQHIFKFGKSSN
jgi:hypothetical protein